MYSGWYNFTNSWNEARIKVNYGYRITRGSLAKRLQDTDRTGGGGEDGQTSCHNVSRPDLQDASDRMPTTHPHSPCHPGHHHLKKVRAWMNHFSSIAKKMYARHPSARSVRYQ